MLERNGKKSDVYVKEKAGISRFSVRTLTPETYDPSLLSELVSPIVVAAFQDDFGKSTLESMVANLEDHLYLRHTVFHLLYDFFNNRCVGFSSWFPAYSHDVREYLPFMADIHTSTSYIDVKKQTIQTGFTAILPSYRGKGGWTTLMNVMDSNITSQQYRYMMRVVRTAHSYSEKIARRYEGKIIHTEETEGYGQQIICWIVL